MATIIDRRRNGRGKSIENRRRFIRRHQKQIRDQVDAIADDRSIKDIADTGTVTVTGDDEPSIVHGKGGTTHRVLPGNKEYNKGDFVNKPPRGDGRGGSGNSGDGQDEYLFKLTKEELVELYLNGLELPNFIKKALEQNTSLVYKRSGYTTEGSPQRLDLKKTFEQSLARRIATRGEGKKKPRFLDDIDMRYKLFTPTPVPVHRAVMFLLMDVSGSMGELQKYASKKFFLLLYLFLTTVYEHVEIRFIRYHHEAFEVSEEEFFYGTDSGGTVVSEALKLTNKIIEEEVNTENTNVYIAHSSDGDTYPVDAETQAIREQALKLMSNCQYYTYLQVLSEKYATYYEDDYGLMGIYENLFADEKKFAAEIVVDSDDIHHILHEFFGD